jgi:hypothetical protein
LGAFVENGRVRGTVGKGGKEMTVKEWAESTSFRPEAASAQTAQYLAEKGAVTQDLIRASHQNARVAAGLGQGFAKNPGYFKGADLPDALKKGAVASILNSGDPEAIRNFGHSMNEKDTENPKFNLASFLSPSEWTHVTSDAMTQLTGAGVDADGNMGFVNGAIAKQIGDYYAEDTKENGRRDIEGAVHLGGNRDTADLMQQISQNTRSAPNNPIPIT